MPPINNHVFLVGIDSAPLSRRHCFGQLVQGTFGGFADEEISVLAKASKAGLTMSSWPLPRLPSSATKPAFSRQGETINLLDQHRDGIACLRRVTSDERVSGGNGDRRILTLQTFSNTLGIFRKNIGEMWQCLDCSTAHIGIASVSAACQSRDQPPRLASGRYFQAASRSRFAPRVCRD